MIKKVPKSILTLLGSLFLLIVVTALLQPSAINVNTTMVVIFLIYAVSSSFIYLVISLAASDKKGILQMSLLLGCLPPAIIVLVALRQATVFDISLIILTVLIVFWYSFYKK